MGEGEGGEGPSHTMPILRDLWDAHMAEVITVSGPNATICSTA